MLDPTAATPLYIQLMETIEQQILSGERNPGERLPSESELAKLYGVSIITVRNAIGGLCEQGMVERKQGKGTFVKKQKYTRNSRKLDGFSDACRSQGLRPGGRMLRNERVILTEKVARSLGLEKGAEGIFISRVRFADDEPVAIEKSYFPIRYDFLLEEVFDDESLFECLKRRAQVKVARADKRIELCRVTAEEGALLHVPEKTPMLFIKSTAYNQLGEPLYVGSQVLNGDQFSLEVTQYADV